MSVIAARGANEEAPISGNKQLVRPVRGDGRVLVGVCAALANRFGVSKFLVRLLFIVAGFVGAGELAYLVLWIIIPKDRR